MIPITLIFGGVFALVALILGFLAWLFDNTRNAEVPCALSFMGCVVCFIIGVVLTISGIEDMARNQMGNSPHYSTR